MKNIFLLIICVLIFPVNNLFSQDRTDINVLDYNIYLDCSNLQSDTIKGKTRVKFIVLESKDSIYLELKQLNVDSILLIDYNSLVDYNQLGDSLWLNLKDISVLDTVTIEVHYKGIPYNEGSFGGVLKSDDKKYLFNMGVAFNEVPHNFGKTWFPCVDNFTDKATYSTRIRVDKKNKAICGGLLDTVIYDSDSTCIWSWRLNQEISTYLASFAVGEYSLILDTINNIPVILASYPSDSINMVNSFVNLEKMVDLFIDKYGPYLWDRIGFVEVPFYYGAMEHATNIGYPEYAVNGQLNFETLIAHELSHHWFGNLVTCNADYEMWINEGWGSYSEALYYESQYGIDAMNNLLKSNLDVTLQKAHINDNGYHALSQVPSFTTYGTTSYKKGSVVIHSLRYFMGDEAFFNATKELMNEYKFKNISTNQFQELFSRIGEIDLTDFFNHWINQKGFTHYSIDSILYEGNSARVFIRQRLKANDAYYNGNKVTIQFVGENNIKKDVLMNFDGRFYDSTYILDFEPIYVLIDPYNQLSDAISTDEFLITNNSMKSSVSTFLTIIPETTDTDTSFIRISHNWVNVQDFTTNGYEIIDIDTNRYWLIDGYFSENHKLKGRFIFSNSTTGANAYTDFGFNIFNVDSLLILYRKNSSCDWEITDFTKSGSLNYCRLTVNDLKLGEYVFAKGRPFTQSINEIINDIDGINLFPNPIRVGDYLNISKPNNFTDMSYSIYNINGKLIEVSSANDNQISIFIDPQKYISGNYIIKIFGGELSINRNFVIM